MNNSKQLYSCIFACSTIFFQKRWAKKNNIYLNQLYEYNFICTNIPLKAQMVLFPFRSPPQPRPCSWCPISSSSWLCLAGPPVPMCMKTSSWCLPSSAVHHTTYSSAGMYMGSTQIANILGSYRLDNNSKRKCRINVDTMFFSICAKGPCRQFLGYYLGTLSPWTSHGNSFEDRTQLESIFWYLI